MAIELKKISETTQYYSFTAQSITEADKIMRSKVGGLGFQGHAETYISADLNNIKTYTLPGSEKQNPGTGWTITVGIKDGYLRYKIEFTFPLWTNIENLSRPIKAEWKRYVKCLWVHERGHVQVAMPLLKTYLEKFRELHGTGTGESVQASESAARDDLTSNLEVMQKKWAEETQNAHDEYDTSTDHGRTQGARFNVDISVGSGSRH